MAGVNRRLGLTDEVVTSALGVLETVLAGPTPRTRRELRVAFDAAGLPTAVQQLAHLVMIAEVRAIVCSGPPRGTEHTYVLVDETLPPAPSDQLGGEDARRELTRRFVSGHGPTTDRDLARWSTLTLGADPRRARRPGRRARAGRGRRAHAVVRPAGAGPHHAGARGLPAADVRRGLPDLRGDRLPPALARQPAATAARPRRAAASSWSRARTSASGSGWCRPSDVRVAVWPEATLGADEVTAIGEAAQALADFVERPLDLQLDPALRDDGAEHHRHSTKGVAPLHGGDALRRSESGRGTQVLGPARAPCGRRRSCGQDRGMTSCCPALTWAVLIWFAIWIARMPSPIDISGSSASGDLAEGLPGADGHDLLRLGRTGAAHAHQCRRRPRGPGPGRAAPGDRGG